MVEDVNDMKDIKVGLDKIKAKHPNLPTSLRTMYFAR